MEVACGSININIMETGFKCLVSRSWYYWGVPRPRKFPGIYLRGVGKFMLDLRLGNVSRYRVDTIWSPYTLEKLVDGKV